MIRSNLSTSKDYQIDTTQVIYSLHGQTVNFNCNVGDYVSCVSNYNNVPDVTGLALVNTADDATNQAYFRLYKATATSGSIKATGNAGAINAVILQAV